MAFQSWREMSLPRKKKIADFDTCQGLVAMIEMRKARVIKEHTEDGPLYAVYSASGTPIGIIGDQYKFMFENLIRFRGSEDGLFGGCSQTTVMT